MNRHSILARLMTAGMAGLVLFAPDDGTGGGGDSNTSQHGGGAGQGDGAQGGAATDSAGRLTPEQQAAVDAEVARQLDASVKPKLTAARQKWEQDLEALADAETQTAEQQAQAAAEAARREADAAIAKANERLVAADARVAAIDAGANPARVPALLKLADLSEVTVGDDGTVDPKALKAAVDKALTEFPEFKADASGGGASGGEHSGGATTITAEQFKAMGYSERAKLRAENPQEYARLAAA